MKLSSQITLAIVLMLPAPAAFAALSIDTGAHALLPNTPNQRFTLSVTGGNAVEGLNLYVQVADGGPAAGGAVVGPAITDVDILAGTIFAGNNLGSFDPGSTPQLASRFTLTSSGTVPASGAIAKL